MKDYKGLDIYGSSDPFNDWYDEERGTELDEIDDELDIAFEDDEDEL
jgi:hypothetical protein